MRAERGIDRIRGQLIVLAARTPDREDDLVDEVDSLMADLEEYYIDALLARIADEDASLVTWDDH